MIDEIGSTRRAGVLLIAGATVAAVALVVAAVVLTGGARHQAADAPPTFDFVIPEGSGDRLARGEVLDVLPAEMTASVGDTIRIVNDDLTGHALGPWYLGPGEVLYQRFASAGTLTGYCSVHPEASFTISVSEA